MPRSARRKARARAIRVNDLAPPDRRRFLLQLHHQDWSAFQRRYRDAIHVSVGSRQREGRIDLRAGPVLKVWVEKKCERPKQRIPPHVTVDFLPMGARGAKKPVRIRIDTDVQAASQPRGVSASPSVHSVPHDEFGSIAARIQFGSPAMTGWLSAAHALSCFGQTGSFETVSPWTVEASGKVLGPNLARSCWLPKGGPHHVDAGVVLQRSAVAVEKAWAAAHFSDWLQWTHVVADAGTPAARRYRFVDQTGMEKSLTYDTDTMAGLVVHYGARSVACTRMFRFQGVVRGGDSGSCVYKLVGDQKKLVGTIVADDGPQGVLAAPIEDILGVLRTEFATTVEVVALAP